jgi:hypothetical protein
MARASGSVSASVANEIVADCRLFPLRQINFDTPEKPYSSSTYPAAEFGPVVQSRWPA